MMEGATGRKNFMLFPCNSNTNDGDGFCFSGSIPITVVYFL